MRLGAQAGSGGAQICIQPTQTLQQSTGAAGNAGVAPAAQTTAVSSPRAPATRQQVELWLMCSSCCVPACHSASMQTMSSVSLCRVSSPADPDVRRLSTLVRITPAAVTINSEDVHVMLQRICISRVRLEANGSEPVASSVTGSTQDWK